MPAAGEGGSDRQLGTVKNFDDAKGYGFITPAEGPDLFVHVSSIPPGRGFRTLAAGQQVSFRVICGKGGKPQASDVEPPGGGGEGSHPRRLGG
jgi:CspA family cold shock protein